MNETKLGRKRSEASRAAILEGAFAIAQAHGYGALTMDALAAHAGVGKQTIYRWWKTRAQVVLEALTFRATAIAIPDTGSLVRDLTLFLRTSFAVARRDGTRELLRGIVVEAQLDGAFREPVRAFIEGRRNALRTVLLNAKGRGDLGDTADVELALDVAFGVLWYRLLFDHAPLDAPAARSLALAVAKTVRRRRRAAVAR